MNSKKKSVPELADEDWVEDLAVLTDICDHLNKLNVKLQGKDNIISDMAQNIRQFKASLALWISQVKPKQF